MSHDNHPSGGRSTSGGTSQPVLLGLDAMYLFDMELHFVRGEFQIHRKIMAPNSTQFRFLDMASLLKKVKLSDSDLVPVGSLPPPEESFKELVNAGKTNCVIDLDTSFSGVLPLVTRPHIVNLGTSN